MYLIQARNVNEAYTHGLNLLRSKGVCERSRVGEVLVMDAPVITAYSHPKERVLFDARRDANPFFHLMEALWMLAGRRDATWLDRFVSDFSTRFAEEDGNQHGAYGYRWRQHFDIDWEGHPYLPDQLEAVIKLLKQNPLDRRAVLTMWDPVADLGAQKKDVPCNTQVYLRIRQVGDPLPAAVDFVDITRRVLDITVCCRSNDAIWGAYGANAVHFSVLQEHLAARIGVDVGTYYQVSNNFHGYTDVLNKLGEPVVMRSSSYPAPVLPLVDDPDSFDSDLAWFFQFTTVTPGAPFRLPKNRFFANVAVPMFQAYSCWRDKRRETAMTLLGGMPNCDWREAALAFFQRRMDKLRAKETAHVG